MASGGLSYKRIINIALPITGGGIGHVAILVADTIFLGRLGITELGSGGNAGILYFIFVMVGSGLATGGQILTGRRNGEGKYKECGRIWWHVLLMMTGYALIAFLLLSFGTHLLLDGITHSKAVAEQATLYIQWRSWGIFFTAINTTFNAFYVGITRTKVISYSLFLMAVVNIVLDYLLIFGAFDLIPAMGVRGAAMASAIAEAVTCGFYILYTLRLKEGIKYGLHLLYAPDKFLFQRIFKLGGPVMMQSLITMGAWFAFFNIVEKIGERALAISHTIRGIYSVMMIPGWGFGQAANTLCSNLIGGKRSDLVMTMIGKSIVITFLINAVIAAVVLAMPHTLLGIFTHDEQLITEATPTLYIVCAAMFFLSAAMIFFQTLTGTGKTLFAFFLESINVIIYLSYCALVVILYHQPVHIAWCSEFVYFGLLGLMSFVYLKSKRWQGTVI